MTGVGAIHLDMCRTSAVHIRHVAVFAGLRRHTHDSHGLPRRRRGQAGATHVPRPWQAKRCHCSAYFSVGRNRDQNASQGFKLQNVCDKFLVAVALKEMCCLGWNKKWQNRISIDAGYKLIICCLVFSIVCGSVSRFTTASWFFQH